MSVELRASQSLKLLHDFAFGLVHDQAPDLSLRQIAVLLTVYLESPPHTVRGLAAKLKVTKPVITRALDTMGRFELLTRRRDPSDRRNARSKARSMSSGSAISSPPRQGVCRDERP